MVWHLLVKQCTVDGLDVLALLHQRHASSHQILHVFIKIISSVLVVLRLGRTFSLRWRVADNGLANLYVRFLLVIKAFDLVTASEDC